MRNAKETYIRIRSYSSLFIVVAIYSLAGFFSKLASVYDFMSFPYLSCLGVVLVVLCFFAILWQNVLKKIPISRAYLFKSLSLVYGLAIAHYAFHEEISLQNLLGCAVVLCGLVILMSEKVRE